MLLDRHISITALSALCALLVSAKSAHSQSPPQSHAKVELMAEESTMRPGQPLWIGILFRLDEGWHIYWQNPGDSGEPPQVQWKPSSRFHSWRDPVAASSTSRERIDRRLWLRRRSAFDGSHSWTATVRANLYSEHFCESEIHRVP